jgi:hypothetical protein
MSKIMGFKKIGLVCELILKLSEDDFADATERADAQVNYIHPLRNSTALSINEAGERNLKIIAAIKKLQSLIKQGAK